MVYYAIEPPKPWANIKGKPYVTVSANGIANGLSDIFNDGADFGPDTPGTQTSGIQEAINYIASLGGGEIQLLSGVFVLSYAAVSPIATTSFYHTIEIPANSTSNPIMTIKIKGIPSSLYDFQTGYNATPSITPINTKGGSIIYNPNYLPNATKGGSAIFGTPPPPSNNLNQNTNIILEDLTFMNPQTPTSASQYPPVMVQLDNFAGFILKNVVVNVDTTNGTLNNPAINGGNGAIGISINQPNNGNGLAILDNVYVVNYYNGIWAYKVQHLHIISAFVQYCGNGLTLGDVGNYPPVIDYIDLEQNTTPVIFVNSTPLELYSAKFQIQNQGAYSSTNWSNAIAQFIDAGTGTVSGEIEVYITGGSTTDNPLFGAAGSGSLSNLYGLVIKQINGLGSIGEYPPVYSVAGTTAGTVGMRLLTNRHSYKKYMVILTGYENNTTTNQTINFPLSFSSYAVITANNTGLTISTSTTGITITSPNNTTTYSGIVIVEGY